ncbi:LacI family DNA-binding transcriptional regulator [Nonomuraea gerenzanensis]|uniref:Transcriptional regulator of rhamnose utilization, LacI family n=1 Tax=Nonomuraea gerenzanensis TaxID=93944 RepID=A0A1M4EGW8_9ACTN|nr:LacI family DNA-binding transcriptional regulator [Nonomuraea gerenzanensis]UBU09718.1 LacI family transcriptional regulator [Nonomuraea gerenzanensis]SBO98155.1 Transcriptional regulator of rhamnose utilization, LacI family [Nonomuraea gerenzanensis]
MATRNIKEVAQLARVSVGTVSNVLNRPEIVSPATRERVFEAIKKLGFVRNEVARHLRVGRSRTVGLVVLDVSNPFFVDVAQGAESVADDHDSMVVLCNSAGDTGRERRHLDQLEQQRVMGILITPVETESPWVEELIARGTPVVLVDSPATGLQCSVAVDDRLGGQIAGAHLIERGHRRIMFAGGPMSIKQVADRHAGVTSAVAAADGAVELLTASAPTLTVAEGRAIGERVAALPPGERPTAAFCANDMMALGFLQAMASHGLRVPEDLAIIGYDDIDFAAAAAVPLSSVRQPRELLGRTAIDLLLEEVADPEQHRHRQVIFQPDLVIRESSALRRDA